MVKVWLDYSDGRYFVRLAKPEDSGKHIYELEKDIYQAYMDWNSQGKVWDMLFTQMENLRSIENE